MRFAVSGVTVDITNISETQYYQIRSHLDSKLETEPKARDAISETFLHAIRLCPEANPSDIWHHVIYRRYMEAKQGVDPGHSWVRAGGEALEVFFAKYYNSILSPLDIQMRPLISRTAKRQALIATGCSDEVGDAKLDTALEGRKDGRWILFGGAHIKGSLAERVTDDVPASLCIMRRGYFSPLLTLDVKSFPPPSGDLVNRGELGSPSKPSEKRKYIEIHGSFDNCYSYNLRTAPSDGPTASGKRVYNLALTGQRDQFVEDLVSHWAGFSSRIL